MANETQITVIGNLTTDPETRQVGEHTVVNLTIASTPRRFDRQKNEWVDEETLFLRANAWREFAENIAQTLRKGNRVVAVGNLKQRTYETKEGEKRTSMELELIEIGHAVPRNRPNAQRAGQPQGGYQNQQNNQQGYQQAPQNGYQNQPQQGYQQAPQPPFYSDETPF